MVSYAARGGEDSMGSFGKEVVTMWRSADKDVKVSA